jgi:hypothetical protein
MTQYSHRAVAAAFFATALLIASAVQAAPITMNPSPVTINGLNGTFTISLTSGDTATNRLNFSVVGSNPPGMLPAAGAAAIVFDGVSVIGAGEISDPHGLITGLAFPGSGTVAGILVDFGAPSTASFFVRLNGAPTTATIYSLTTMSTNTSTLSSWSNGNCSDAGHGGRYHKCTCSKLPYKQKTTVRFHSEETPIPEPSAALCFAAGMLLVATRLRRP